MTEFLLIMILHTDRAASHGHELHIERVPDWSYCDAMGLARSAHEDDTYQCIEVPKLESAD